MKQRPGFMVYHETAKAMLELGNDDLGKLFRAMCEFSASGSTPDFKDLTLRVLWMSIQPKMERDAASYKETCEKNRQNTYIRERNKAQKVGEDFPEYENWVPKCEQIKNQTDIEQPQGNADKTIGQEQQHPSMVMDSQAPISDGDFEQKRSEALYKIENYGKEEYI